MLRVLAILCQRVGCGKWPSDWRKCLRTIDRYLSPIISSYRFAIRAKGKPVKHIIVCLAALGLAACATPRHQSGPLARGVRADAPPDTIGVFLSWTPEQTLVNFRNIDHIFTTHTIRNGDNVRHLSRAAVQIDPVVMQSEGLPTVSIDQLMTTERMVSVVTGRGLPPIECPSASWQYWRRGEIVYSPAISLKRASSIGTRCCSTAFG
jgi:hypothetical protein